MLKKYFYLVLYLDLLYIMKPDLQRMAVFNEILGAQNSCLVRIMSELRGKSNKICVKSNEN